MELPKFVSDFLELEPGPIKNIKYKHLLSKNFTLFNISEKGEDKYYSETTYGIFRGKDNYYIKVIKRKGITYNNKTLKFWYGGNITFIYLNKLFELKKINIEEKYHCLITKTILKDILNGKILSPLEIVTRYFKLNRIKCSPSLFFFKMNDYNMYNLKYLILQLNKITDDINPLLINHDYKIIDHFMANSELIYDMNEKIDFELSKTELLKKSNILFNKHTKLCSETLSE